MCSAVEAEKYPALVQYNPCGAQSPISRPRPHCGAPMNCVSHGHPGRCDEVFGSPSRLSDGRRWAGGKERDRSDQRPKARFSGRSIDSLAGSGRPSRMPGTGSGVPAGKRCGGEGAVLVDGRRRGEEVFGVSSTQWLVLRHLQDSGNLRSRPLCPWNGERTRPGPPWRPGLVGDVAPSSEFRFTLRGRSREPVHNRVPAGRHAALPLLRSEPTGPSPAWPC